MSRVGGTNFRFMDIDVLNYLGREDEVNNILTHTYLEFSRLFNHDLRNYSKKQYILDMTRRVVHNELLIRLLGYSNMSTHWQDFARNISLLGDRYDVEGIFKKPEVFHRNYIVVIGESIEEINSAVLSFYSIFKKSVPDLSLAEFILNMISTYIHDL